ncbi:MAG: hypothetical protein IKO07_09915 [Clostridia bacterium]|nr:hypothetical protein [Clostridia bacterium]
MYFTPEDWARTIEVYEAWWAGRLKRPLITARRSFDQRPQISKSTCGDFSKSPDEVIAEIDHNIAHTDCYGDAFPFAYWAFFGPGALASYLGSPVQTDQNTVWFHPLPGEPALSDIHLELDRDNPWFNRCKDLYWAGVKKWRGRVVMGMNDIGGELDVVASLVGTERLLYAMLDEPAEVKRLCEEAHAVWQQAYWAFMEILSENNPAFADWAGLLSEKPYYTQQCDFSYMISPDMFDEFVDPYLRQTSDTLGHSLYHLDGKGALVHLDKILAIDRIEAVQWQPGDGAGFGYKWIDVYRKIRNAGRRMHFIGSQDDFRAVTDDVGAEGMYFATGFGDERQMNAFFDRFEETGETPYRRG